VQTDPSGCRYEVFRVGNRWSGAAVTRQGVCALVLPVGSASAADAAVRALRPDARRGRCLPAALREAVRSYFDGRGADFSRIRLDLSGGTPFQRRVWEVARRIPYGQTRSYGWIAREIGRPGASRAVGRALGANPLPLLVPCHRVVRNDGAIGGFSAPGGAQTKVRLLGLERRPIRRRARLPGDRPRRPCL